MIELGLLVVVIFNIASRVVNVVDDVNGLLLERKNSAQWFCRMSMRAQWQCFMKAPPARLHVSSLCVAVVFPASSGFGPFSDPHVGEQTAVKISISEGPHEDPIGPKRS